jgi:DnaJ family protein A protein 2
VIFVNMFFGGDPFGDGGFPGGFPGMGGRGKPQGPVDNKEYYDLLGVDKDASEAEIKRAYKKGALKYHPDKGGDQETFQKFSAAADVLMDKEKRAQYDKYGKEGISDDGGGGGADASDIFSQMFGGGRGGGGRRGPQKGEDIKHSIKVSLEDLYNGKTVRLAISRNKPCSTCDGVGGKSGCEKHCDVCNGRGVKVTLRQIGPGMVQQMQSTCPACKGEGKAIADKDRCSACKGQKVMKDRKVLEVNIEKGMRNGHKIKFSGEADEIPGTIPGDVVIAVQEKDHDTFKRKGGDLVSTVNLTLSEALCGFTKVITHLDGRTLRIESPAGEVIKTDQVKSIEDEGMPTHGNPFVKGKLFLLFKVTFPKTLPLGTVKALKEALPPARAPMLSDEDEECTMRDVDISQFGASEARGARNAYDEDDEDEGRGGAQSVQCGQQ